MRIPESFVFSQSSLQDYVDCPRRFQLRHVLMQPWPSLITGEPGELEQHVQRGARFHRLVHQHHLGLDEADLALSIADPVLARWWQVYLAKPPQNLPGSIQRPEIVLSAPLAGFRLLAKIDLLCADPGQRLVILDWKTVLRRPSRQTLRERLQTRVYRCLAVMAGACCYGDREPPPEQVEMVYWFAEFGGSIEMFSYDADQHAMAVDSLVRLISEIASLRASMWLLAEDGRYCVFCNYRSLCERDVRPGFLGDLDWDTESGPPGLDFDLEQIAEIAF